jgi:hypothetical protein
VKPQPKSRKMNVNEMLLNDQENGNLILNLGIAQKSNGDLSTYGDICGSWYDGVHQWASHNIYSLDEVENQKYRGYIVTDSMGEQSKFVIPQWVLKKDIGKDWKYAKNLFCKFLKRI